MSQGNVEIMRRGLDAFNRHDVDTLVALSCKDIELVTLRSAMEGTVYRGPDAFVRAFRDFDESWEDLRYEIADMRDGEDWVLGFGMLRGRGRGSGVEVEARLAWLVRVRDGKIESLRTYFDTAQALEAAGLSE
jgi:ketosteroid isomerase-like protein